MTIETKEKIRVILENFLYLLLLRLALFLFFFAFKHPFAVISRGPYLNPIVYYSLAGLIHWYIGGRIGKTGIEGGKSIVVAIHVPYLVIAGVTGGTIWPSSFSLTEYVITSCVFLILALTSSQARKCQAPRRKWKGDRHRGGDTHEAR